MGSAPAASVLSIVQVMCILMETDMCYICCWWGPDCLPEYSDGRSFLLLDAKVLAHLEMPTGNTQQGILHAWPTGMYWYNVSVIGTGSFWIQVM